METGLRIVSFFKKHENVSWFLFIGEVSSESPSGIDFTNSWSWETCTQSFLFLVCLLTAFGLSAVYVSAVYLLSFCLLFLLSVVRVCYLPSLRSADYLCVYCMLYANCISAVYILYVCYSLSVYCLFAVWLSSLSAVWMFCCIAIWHGLSLHSVSCLYTISLSECYLLSASVCCLFAHSLWFPTSVWILLLLSACFLCCLLVNCLQSAESLSVLCLPGS